jgi:hypothetical protein
LNADERDAATTVKAMERAFERENMGKFGTAEKAAVALKLIDGWGKDLSTIPDPTKEKARALFDAINRYFDAFS